jgi:large subunit ribosomal protein L21
MADKIAKKAVIATGGKQYLVSPGDELLVELLPEEKNISFEALLVIDGTTTSIGRPTVDGVKVSADIVDREKGDKVVAIRYKSKKRVRKVRGHRQQFTRIKISNIS